MRGTAREDTPPLSSLSCPANCPIDNLDPVSSKLQCEYHSECWPMITAAATEGRLMLLSANLSQGCGWGAGFRPATRTARRETLGNMML